MKPAARKRERNFRRPPGSRGAKGLLRLVAAVTMAAIFSVRCVQTQTAPPSEYQVKAVYLYNFGKFVQWPGSATAASSPRFSICVLGEDPFGTILDTVLANETIAGKPAQARRLTRATEASTCHILFISSAESGHLPEILSSLNGGGVLTVSDMERFTDRGGMIQFVWDRQRVRFEVNLAAAARAGLALSSDLLKVATRVRS